MTRPSLPTLSLRTARNAVIVLVVFDLLALFAFSVRTTTTTARTVTPLAVATPVAAATTPPSAALVAGPPVAAPAPVVPVAAAPPQAGPIAVPVAPQRSTRPTSSVPPLPSSPPSVPPSAAAATCPIPLQPPAQNGGLQSLISFAPAFGDFTSEAFAMAAAYQPALQLIGPILAQYPSLAPRIDPLVTPLLNQWQGVETPVYALIAPYYTPHRTQVLDAESKLAAALAPYAQKLANSALGACVVDLEAALMNDTRT
jgi:hypothetical protein